MIKHCYQFIVVCVAGRLAAWLNNKAFATGFQWFFIFSALPKKREATVNQRTIELLSVCSRKCSSPAVTAFDLDLYENALDFCYSVLLARDLDLGGPAGWWLIETEWRLPVGLSKERLAACALSSRTCGELRFSSASFSHPGTMLCGAAVLNLWWGSKVRDMVSVSWSQWTPGRE